MSVVTSLEHVADGRISVVCGLRAGSSSCCSHRYVGNRSKKCICLFPLTCLTSPVYRMTSWCTRPLACTKARLRSTIVLRSIGILVSTTTVGDGRKRVFFISEYMQSNEIDEVNSRQRGTR